jgi:hypothetical protein
MTFIEVNRQYGGKVGKVFVNLSNVTLVYPISVPQQDEPDAQTIIKLSNDKFDYIDLIESYDEVKNLIKSAQNEG